MSAEIVYILGLVITFVIGAVFAVLQDKWAPKRQLLAFRMAVLWPLTVVYYLIGWAMVVMAFIFQTLGLIVAGIRPAFIARYFKRGKDA